MAVVWQRRAAPVGGLGAAPTGSPRHGSDGKPRTALADAAAKEELTAEEDAAAEGLAAEKLAAEPTVKERRESNSTTAPSFGWLLAFGWKPHPHKVQLNIP